MPEANSEELRDETNRLLNEISLKTRILREHAVQTTRHTTSAKVLSDRHMICLELIENNQATEKALSNALDIHPSAASKMVSDLVADRFVSKGKGRPAPLKLTDAGRMQLNLLKQGAATRFKELTEGFSSTQFELMIELMRKLNQNAGQIVNQQIFGLSPGQVPKK